MSLWPWAVLPLVLGVHSLVRIGVIHHESRPLRHLTQVAVCVVEVFDGGDVGVGRDHKWRLQPGLVSEDTGWDRNVVQFLHTVQNTQVRIKTPQTHEYIRRIQHKIRNIKAE